MILRNKKFLTIIIVLLNVYLDDVITVDSADVEKYLQTGTKLLAAGQLMDALLQYDKAVDGDPNNYLIYYRRATVYLGLGKTKSALEDLSSSLTLNPGFTPARSQRATLYIKQGRLQEAKDDINILLTQKPDDEELQKSLKNLDELEVALKSAKYHYDNEECSEAISFLNTIIETMTLSQNLREMRGNCFLKVGEKQKAILDFRQSLKFSNDDREGILRLSQLLYETGSAELSLLEIRECLKLDPDHKDCFKHYKKIKKLVQLLNSIQDATKEDNFNECIIKAKKLASSEPNYSGTANKFLCTCEVKGGNPKEAIGICEEAHNSDPSNIDFIYDLADGYMANEDYDNAIKYYQKAHELDNNSKRAKDGIKKAQKIQKNARKRNYYKILDVPRTATKRDILRAYRKLAAQYHPDSYKGTDKKVAERKFIDISDAKEVLSNDEKRQQYDNGDDPLDPEHQYQGPSGGHSGFTFHNFNPFENQGGGYQYEFHFG